MKTNWYATQLLRDTFRGTPLALPATWYLAASIEPFDPAMTGVTLVEGAGAGYGRAAIARTPSKWSAPALLDGVIRIANIARILWPGAVDAWLPIESIYLCDADAGGNAWYGDDLADPLIVPAGEALSLGPGNAVFTER